LDVPELELTVISVPEEEKQAFPAPITLQFSQTMRKEVFHSSERELTVLIRNV